MRQSWQPRLALRSRCSPGRSLCVGWGVNLWERIRFEVLTRSFVVWGRVGWYGVGQEPSGSDRQCLRLSFVITSLTSPLTLLLSLSPPASPSPSTSCLSQPGDRTKELVLEAYGAWLKLSAGRGLPNDGAALAAHPLTVAALSGLG